MKKAISLLLSLTLALSLSVPALAYSSPDFEDVPPSHWAYEAVMRMADAGYVKGTGEGQFSPRLKVSAAQFLTLVGRVIFPEVAVEESDTWYGPYMAAAQEAGLMDGTALTVSDPEAEVSRYDMAVVLAKAAGELGAKETPAQQAEVSDFGDIPNKYTAAVLAVYGAGLITGDETGRFNGSLTMGRDEMATVLDRLTSLEQKQRQEQEAEDAKAQAEAEKEFQDSRTGETVTVHVWGNVTLIPGGTIGFYYKDGRLLGQTVADETGAFEMDVTMDKADYSYTEPLYYAALIGDGMFNSRTPITEPSFSEWKPSLRSLREIEQIGLAVHADPVS